MSGYYFWEDDDSYRPQRYHNPEPRKQNFCTGTVTDADILERCRAAMRAVSPFWRRLVAEGAHFQADSEGRFYVFQSGGRHSSDTFIRFGNDGRTAVVTDFQEECPVRIGMDDAPVSEGSDDVKRVRAVLSHLGISLGPLYGYTKGDRIMFADFTANYEVWFYQDEPDRTFVVHKGDTTTVCSDELHEEE